VHTRKRDADSLSTVRSSMPHLSIVNPKSPGYCFTAVRTLKSLGNTASRRLSSFSGTQGKGKFHRQSLSKSLLRTLFPTSMLRIRMGGTSSIAWLLLEPPPTLEVQSRSKPPSISRRTTYIGHLFSVLFASGIWRR